MKKQSFKLLPQVLPFAVFLSFSPWSHADTGDTLREQSVQQVQQGQVQQGLGQLKQLIMQNPTDQKLLADYLLLAAKHSQLNQEDLLLVDNIDAVTFPSYAQMPVLQILRDAKQFQRAQTLAEKFDSQKPTQDLGVLLGVLYAENKQPASAEKRLSTLNLDQLSANQLAQIAYAYRQINKPIEALQVSQLAYKKDPKLTSVQQEYVYSLADLGSYQEAFSIAQQKTLAESHPELYKRVYAGLFAQKVNDAIQNYKYLSLKGESDPDSFARLDAILKEYKPFEQSLQIQDPENLRFYYDYMYALNFRGRPVEVLQISQQLNQPVADRPAYVRHAIADSYLVTRKPEQAEALYKTILPEKNYVDMDVYTGLYYSYIAQEKYAEANQLIQQIEPLLPTFQYSLAKGVDRSVHPDREEYIILKGLDSAYSNNLSQAEQYFQDIIAKTPNNQRYINELSKIQRWRKKPQQAQQTLDRLNGLTPVEKATRVNAMKNAEALEDIQAWRQQNQNLYQNYYPTDTGVLESRKTLKDRDRFSISHQMEFGKSDSDQDTLLQSLKGSRDRESLTRIFSPWLYENYRAFAEYQDRWGEFDDGNIHEQRIGVGVEWASKRKNLSLMLAQDTDGDRAGVQFSWSHWLNDHWQYQFGYNSQANIPLQAVKLGEDGQSYLLGLNWQANESREASISYMATDISDGNLRQEVMGNFTQRIFQRPHHTTQAIVSGYYGHNDLNSAVYFNPKDSASAEVKLTHDWLTWRRYDRSFNQHFEAGVGGYKQNDYSTKEIYSVQYKHEWQLSRTWKLNYGVAWGLHPYDGEDEERVSGMLGFEGVF